MTAIVTRVFDAFFDARERHRAARERPQQHVDAERPGGLAGLDGLLGEHALGDRADVLHEDAVEPGDDEDDQHQDVEVRGTGEEGARLLHTAQVREGHDDDAREAQRHRPLVAEPGGGANGEHATRHRHGDGEDVVDQERRPRDERRDLAEVLLRHDVAAAAARVGVDGLPVAGHHDHEQHADDDRNGRDGPPRLRADLRLQQQHHEDLVGGVGGGRDCIAGEDRECDLLAQTMVALIGGGDGPADEETLERLEHSEAYPTPGYSAERQCREEQSCTW
jgi:hypothetical protein